LCSEDEKKNNQKNNKINNDMIEDWIFSLFSSIDVFYLQNYDLEFVFKYLREKDEQKKTDFYLLSKIFQQIVYLPYSDKNQATKIIDSLDNVLKPKMFVIEDGELVVEELDPIKLGFVFVKSNNNN
jgi:hypothetical protein